MSKLGQPLTDDHRGKISAALKRNAQRPRAEPEPPPRKLSGAPTTNRLTEKLEALERMILQRDLTVEELRGDLRIARTELMRAKDLIEKMSAGVVRPEIDPDKTGRVNWTRGFSKMLGTDDDEA